MANEKASKRYSAWNPLAYADWWSGNEGILPDAWTGGTPTGEAYSGVKYDPSMGDVHDAAPMIGTQGKWDNTKGNALYYGATLPVAPAAAAVDYLVDGEFGYADDNPYSSTPDGQLGMKPLVKEEPKQSMSLTEFDMSDKNSVMALQRRLGVKADGMFGPETEKAYRLAVDKERAGKGDASLRYDWNDQMLQDRVDNSKTKIGGLLKKGWTNFDKNVLKGKGPGGYRPEYSNMTAEEFYSQNG